MELNTKVIIVWIKNCRS